EVGAHVGAALVVGQLGRGAGVGAGLDAAQLRAGNRAAEIGPVTAHPLVGSEERTLDLLFVVPLRLPVVDGLGAGTVAGREDAASGAVSAEEAHRTGVCRGVEVRDHGFE